MGAGYFSSRTSGDLKFYNKDTETRRREAMGRCGSGGKGGGKGSGKGGNPEWPSKTGKPSGGGRGNNPPSKPSK